MSIRACRTWSKTHLLHVFAKLDMHTRAELAAAAIRHGLG
jgi:DNA-binding CsgD family transcriptional regulator